MKPKTIPHKLTQIDLFFNHYPRHNEVDIRFTRENSRVSWHTMNYYNVAAFMQRLDKKFGPRTFKMLMLGYGKLFGRSRYTWKIQS